MAQAGAGLGGARFIGSEIYRRSTYGSGHPLAIPRVSTCIDLCRALGWLPDSVYLDSPRATPAELTRFHDPDYIAALIEIEREGRADPERRRRFNVGINGNPIFPEIFSRPATASGGTLLAARLLLEARATPGTARPIVYSPAGGTHHGRPDRASGFCYLNDPVLGILALLDGGPGGGPGGGQGPGFERVFYLDVDAHHGDGVQDAFAREPRVFTLSLHEAGRWPLAAGSTAGTLADRGGGDARNLPLPEGFNDDELAFLLEAAVLPLIERFEPTALVLQCGADALAEDPMSRLALSNRALWSVAAALRDLGLPLIVLGGGGYNPWSVARCWTGVWATLNRLPPPERLPEPAEAVLRALSWRHRQGRNPPETWFTTLADRWRHGSIRPEIRAMAKAVLAA